MEKQVFISYASEDAEQGTSICRLLEQQGLRCWIAPRDITPGASYAEEIIKAIERTQALVLVMSENANNSPHVNLEVERAVSKAKTVFPVRIRECTPSKRLEYFVSGSQWIDAWASPLEMKVVQLANAIKALTETGRVTGTGEWKLGVEGGGAGSEEPPTLNSQRETSAIAPIKKSGISPATISGAIVGLCVLLGVAFFLSRTESKTKAVNPKPLAQTLPTQTPSVAPLVSQSSSSSIQLTERSSSSSQPAESALSLAIARSLKDAETKIFNSSVATLPSQQPIALTAASVGSVAVPPPAFQSTSVAFATQSSQQSLAQSSAPVIDPALPLPRSSDATVVSPTLIANDTPKPVLESSSNSSSLDVAAVAPKPIVRKTPPKPKAPTYPTVRSAKLAYKAGEITKVRYREIVTKLEETYDTRVRQLKVDYRAGKISRDEYGRQVRELKTKIYG